MDDEDKFENFDINNNSENELMCLFDENLGNIDQIVDNEKKIENCPSIETMLFSSYSSICNVLYNVIKTLMRELHLSMVYYWM